MLLNQRYLSRVLIGTLLTDHSATGRGVVFSDSLKTYRQSRIHYFAESDFSVQVMAAGLEPVKNQTTVQHQACTMTAVM